MPPPEDLGRRKRPVSAVSNLANDPRYGKPLAKQRPAWEGGGDEEEHESVPSQQQAQPAAPRQSPRQAPAAPPAQQQGGGAMPQQGFSSMERQGLRVIAKLVHESVMNADEPGEFVDKVLDEWQPQVLRQVIGPYTVEQIITGVIQIAPQSAGATPEGQKFMREAFSDLQEELAQP